MFPPGRLHTVDGRDLEILNPGEHNTDAGPDFFTGVVKIDGLEMAGNIEIHTRSSDWYRHGHDTDPAYCNVILHVVETADREIRDLRGRVIPQFEMQVPRSVEENYAGLLREEKFPPCYRIVPDVESSRIERMLSRLAAERMEKKRSA